MSIISQETWDNMSKLKVNVGDRYERLTIIKELEPTRYSDGQIKRTFLCKCDCGNEVVRGLKGLRSGRAKSCGCLKIERHISKIKEANPRLYRIWQGMRGRCKSSNSLNYGGRGITVCNEWDNSFESFCEWALSHGYKDGLTIDRINVNGNYSPENCRWATIKEQCNNTRQTRWITFNGITKSLSQWSEETGLSRECIWYRICSHGVTDDLFKTPQIRNKKN